MSRRLSASGPTRASQFRLGDDASAALGQLVADSGLSRSEVIRVLLLSPTAKSVTTLAGLTRIAANGGRPGFAVGERVLVRRGDAPRCDPGTIETVGPSTAFVDFGPGCGRQRVALDLLCCAVPVGAPALSEKKSGGRAARRARPPLG